MSPRQNLARLVSDLIAGRVPFAQALVVRAQRPTSVRAGDGAIVLGDGRIEGFVGGTCAESTVRLHGLQVLRTGMPLLLRILPEPGPADAGPVDDGAVTVRNPCLSGGALEIFLEPHVPPPRVTVVGDTPIARALADLGGRLGYQVEASAGGDIAPGPGDAAVVVASHGRDEERALTRALREGVPYVGLVASRRRGAAVIAALDVEPALGERVRSPAGLDIGARTAGEIALSILAEIIGTRPSPVAGAGAMDTAAGEPNDHASHAHSHSHSHSHSDSDSDTGAEEAPTAIDPVCGMTVVAAEPTPHLDRGGERVWFCGDGCLRAFAAAAEGGA